MSTVGDELWDQLLFKLKAAGTSLNEIDDCSAAVLQNVLLDLGFSNLQCAKLQTLWTRRQQTRAPSAGLDLSSNSALGAGGLGAGGFPPAASSATSSHLTSQHGLVTVVPAGSSEHAEIAEKANNLLGFCTELETLIVERLVDPSLEHSFRQQRSHMFNTGTVPLKKWVLTSNESLAAVLNGTGGSKDLGNLIGWDTISRSGLVFHGEEGHSIPSGAVESLRDPRLCLCEVVLGNTKLMEEDDVAMLNHFSPEQCRRSLVEEGYDSLQVRRSSPEMSDVFVLFSPAQCLPRYVVTPGHPNTDFRGTTLSPMSAAAVSPSRGRATAMQSGAPHYQQGRYGITHGIPDIVAAKCKEHPTKDVEFWCGAEAKLLCSHCMFLEREKYNSMHCVLIEEAGTSERAGLKVWVEAAHNWIKDSGSVLISFDSALDRIEMERQEQLKAVQKHMAEMRDHLEEVQDRLEDEIRLQADEQAKTVQRCLNDVVTTVSKVEDCVEDAVLAIKSGDNVGVLQAQQTACQNWQAIHVPAYSVPKLVVDSQAAKEAFLGSSNCALVTGPVELPSVVDPMSISKEVLLQQQRVGNSATLGTRGQSVDRGTRSTQPVAVGGEAVNY